MADNDVFKPGSFCKSEDIISAFKFYDAEGTGIISKDEFGTLMKRILPNGLCGQMDTLIDLAQAKTSCGVDYTKYTDWLFAFRPEKRDTVTTRRKTNLLHDLNSHTSATSSTQLGRFQYCTVVLATDPTLVCEIELCLNVGEVKDRLYEEFEVAPDRQRLIFGSQEVDLQSSRLSKSLISCGIQESALLFLIEDSSCSSSQLPTLGQRKILVTVHLAEDSHSANEIFRLELSQGSSVDVVRREVSKKTGIPLCCLSMKREDTGASISKLDDLVADGDVFEVRDHELRSIGPYALSTTDFEDEDFIFPADRQCLLSCDTTAVAIRREAFQGGSAILTLCISKWPLVLILGPLTGLTLSGGEREFASIPEEAVHYSWLYPASVDWRALSSTLRNMNMPDMDLVMSGGFVYFDSDIKVVAVQSVRASKRGGLTFSDAMPMPREVSTSLFLQGRVHRVTNQAITQLGVRSFAWVNPGETFDGDEDEGEHVFAEHGGFAFYYHHSSSPTEEEAGGDRFFAILGVDPHETLGHLISIVLEEQADRIFHHPSCFSPAYSRAPSYPNLFETPKARNFAENLLSIQCQDDPLSVALRNKKTDWDAANNAALNIRNENYHLGQFHADMIAAFPELELYRHDADADAQCASGRTAQDEYLRTIGALFAVYWLMRLDIGGQESFCYGVDEETSQIREVPDVTVREGLQWSVMTPDQRKIYFFRNMCWDKALDLFVQAGLLISDGNGGWTHDVAATKAMLVLTAIHDIMKNEALLPVVDVDYAPYEGHDEGVVIRDHDIALAYILENYPRRLPSYWGLDENSRRRILFTQGRMGFNNGWLVQAEAPPGPLFSNICEVIQKGSASQKDIAFYFVHWVTDLAGAVPKPFDGCLKFTVQFPVFVLRAFFDSFPFLWRLAAAEPADVYLDYLEWRWSNLSLPLAMADLDESAVALSRLCTAVQSTDKAKKVIEAWDALCEEDKALLSAEMGLTGIEDGQYKWGAPSENVGPCFLCYYSPAFLLKHLGCDRPSAIKVLVEVYRAGRILFPSEADKAGEFRTLQVAQLKEIMSEDIPNTVTLGEAWVLVKRSDKEAVVEKHPLSSLVIGGTKALDDPFVLLPLWSGSQAAVETPADGVVSVHS